MAKPRTELRRPGGGVLTHVASAPPVEPPQPVKHVFVRGEKANEGVPPEVWERSQTSAQTSADVSTDVSRRSRDPVAPRGSKAIVTRQGARERRRTTVYFSPTTGEQLTAYCRREGRELSVVVDEAVRALLARRR